MLDYFRKHKATLVLSIVSLLIVLFFHVFLPAYFVFDFFRDMNQGTRWQEAYILYTQGEYEKCKEIIESLKPLSENPEKCDRLIEECNKALAEIESANEISITGDPN
jgi:hypothetical protein